MLFFVILLSVLFILSGIVVWVADVITKTINRARSYEMSIGYSFFLSIIGGIVILVGGIMCGCYRKKSETRVG